MASNHFECTYKGALALNNYGIALLEHHCYEQAASTLRDAMQAMKDAFHVNDQRGYLTPRKIKVDQYLQDCFSRLANPVAVYHPSCICIHTITGGQTDYPMVTSEVHKTPQVIFNPVRIDDQRFECNGEQEELDLVAATIVYNFAIATWCISMTFQSSTISSQSLSMFMLSSHSLDRLEMECEDEEKLRTIVCLNALVVGIILRIVDYQQETGQQVAGGLDNQDQEGFKLRLEDLQMKIQWIDAIFSYWTEMPPVAAAA